MVVNREGNCAGNGRRPRLKRRCDEFGTRGSSSPAGCRFNLFGKIVNAMYACSTNSLITSPEQQLKKGPWFLLWYFKDRYHFSQIVAGDLELETFAICPQRSDGVASFPTPSLPSRAGTKTGCKGGLRGGDQRTQPASVGIHEAGFRTTSESRAQLFTCLR